MPNFDSQNLPVTDVLEQLKDTLATRHEAVLLAPPGAGKTTLVPLVLNEEEWLQGQKIIVLEPRRVATRAAASRMAELLGEPVGKSVGYRIRLDNCVGKDTRIEVVTEGILTRMLQRDPGLEGVGLVIFDEFHERNLDSDLCLALCLLGRENYREGAPLKLLAMSASLDGDGVAKILGDAPVVVSEGRQHPVDVVYGKPYQLRDSIIEPVVNAIEQALAKHEGSVLVFLPGQREITRVSRALSAILERGGEGNILLEHLYGSLPLERQQRAIQAPAAGKRKIVLATNIAETSLTIEGVNIVVDSGLARVAIFDPGTGITRLTTRRISRASATQRKGRAGRQAPGVCYRLWSEQQHERLVAYAVPEILQEDLSPMALQLLSWGVTDPGELSWMDLPPEAAYHQAIETLQLCGAAFITEEKHIQLTPHGVRLAQMPLHPRLAHMLLVGCDVHATETACLLAAILSERNPLSKHGVDIGTAVSVLMGEERCPDELQGWFKRIWKQARRYARLASEVHKPRKFALDSVHEDILGILLASAYPDRIARLRSGSDGVKYQLSNGRTAVLRTGDALSGEEWLAVAELGGTSGGSEDVIYSASVLSAESFSDILSSLVSEDDQVDWDYRNERFVAEKHRKVGKLVLSVDAIDDVSSDEKSKALLGVIRKKGLSVLPWNSNLLQWRQRITLMHKLYADSPDNPWPDMSDEKLLDTVEDWLLPFLDGINNLKDFQRLNLKDILRAHLPWPLPLELERLAPERWAAPSGSSVVIDYSHEPPVLAIKLQEMFGCEETPTIADGRASLMLHLLSPAQRPLQITQDLKNFWQTGYEEVRKEMKGRYPKHPWPDNPLEAMPTRHVKRRTGSD
jgi:ATP-dependent RNA helicase HrpB